MPTGCAGSGIGLKDNLDDAMEGHPRPASKERKPAKKNVAPPPGATKEQ